MSICRLSLSEDPSLMMAFSMARRAAAVPLLLVNGTYKSTVSTYLDSAILQHQLQRLNEHNSLKGIFNFLLYVLFMIQRLKAVGSELFHSVQYTYKCVCITCYLVCVYVCSLLVLETCKVISVVWP